MALFTVNTNLDVDLPDDGILSLREAIRLANGNGEADTITFAAALSGQPIDVTVDELVIRDDLAINGPGADALTIRTPSAFDVFRIEADGITVAFDGINVEGGNDSVEITAGSNQNTVTISNSRIGATFGDDGLVIEGDNNTVTVENSVFQDAEDNIAIEIRRPPNANPFVATGNTLVVRNSTITLGREDGVEVDGNSNVITVENSTIDNNGLLPLNDRNDGFDVDGEGNIITIRQATFSSNGEDGLDIEGPNNRVTVEHSTFAGNTRNGILNQDESLANRSVIAISDSIVAGNGRDVAQDAVDRNSVPLADGIRSDGHNLIGNGTWAAIRDPNILDPATRRPVIVDFASTGSAGFDRPGDQVAAPSTPGPVSVGLGPLQDNGGPTLTHALLPGSPAINAGDPNFAPPPDFDQRGPGFPRVEGGRIDIGAFEADFPDIRRTIVTLDSLSVREAGEDGDNGFAEWRLFFNGPIPGIAPFRSDEVRDGFFRAFDAAGGEAEGTLRFRVGGFENDTAGDRPAADDDFLPAIEVEIRPPADGGLPFLGTESSYTVVMRVWGRLEETGGGGTPDVNHSDFAYEVEWRVEPTGSGQPTNVTVERLGVVEAGEDGDNGLAEWNPTFVAGNVGSLRGFAPAQDTVEDNEDDDVDTVVNANTDEVFDFGPIGPGNPANVLRVARPDSDLILRTAGFEDDGDRNLPDMLPAGDVVISPFEDGFDLAVAVDGGDFAYEVHWRVELV